MVNRMTQFNDEPICDCCGIEISRCVHGWTCPLCKIEFYEDDFSCNCTREDVYIDDEEDC